MKKIQFYLSAAILGSGLLLGSCSKEQGCTNACAKNYNAEAEEDDGSCVYPTISENMVGTWAITGVTESVRDYEGVITTNNQYDSGTAIFNNDGTGSFITNGEVFYITWTAANSAVSITVEDENEVYTVTTNTCTKQVWKATSTETVEGLTETFNTEVTLTK